MMRRLALLICPALRDELRALQSGYALTSVVALIARLAWYYNVNDCDECHPRDPIEVPVSDLKEAVDFCAALGIEARP